MLHRDAQENQSRGGGGAPRAEQASQAQLLLRRSRTDNHYIQHGLVHFDTGWMGGWEAVPRQGVCSSKKPPRFRAHLSPIKQQQTRGPR
jgi:hypothetical protein